MEGVLAARALARKKINAADHILTQTYPLVKDPKLLLAVVTNIAGGVDAAITALLGHEREKGRISIVGTDASTRMAQLAQHAREFGIPAASVRFVSELRETIQEHQESSVEFVRRNTFVICDDSYRLRTLNEDQLRRHLGHAKGLLADIEGRMEQ